MKEFTRREWGKGVGSVLTAGAMAIAGCARVGRERVKRSPNLLFVFPDQMRPQTLGFVHEDPALTPNLDRFAEESLVLTDAVSTRPVCSPYRAMLMTGKYYASNGVPYNCMSYSAPIDNELRESDRCISDVLKDQGYSLGYIGKWHLDAPREPYVDTSNNEKPPAWNEWCPPHRRHGFDHWYAYGTYDNHFRPEYWVNDMPRQRRKAVEQWSPEHEADEAIRYLRNEGGTYRRDDEPFALFVGMNPPHTPYHMVPEEYLAQYEGKTWEDLLIRPNVPLDRDSQAMRDAKRDIKNYLAMVTGVDAQFGRILAALGDLGLADDTIVVFTSDHGNCVGCHDHGTKGKIWDECYRVPFLIRWPGRIPVRQDRLLLQPPDLMPTLLGLMGFDDAIPREVEGTDFSGIFRGGDGPRPASALYMAPPYPPQRDLGWNERGVRTERYTMMMKRLPDEPPEDFLFDNEEDAYQLRNIASEQPGLVEELCRNELSPWLERIGDPWGEQSG